MQPHLCLCVEIHLVFPSEETSAFHEFFNQNSCTFPRCMFNHNITDEDRATEANKKRMSKKRTDVQSRKREIEANNGTGAADTERKEICETAFTNGPDSCTNESCTLEHQLDYQRIRRGICHFFVKNRCYRKDKCLFSHQLPSSVLNCHATIQAADLFLQKGQQRVNEETRRVQRNVEDGQATRSINHVAATSSFGHVRR